MKRREFITVAAGTSAVPMRALAQRQTEPLIGYLNGIPLTDRPKMLDAIRDRLARQGSRGG